MTNPSRTFTTVITLRLGDFPPFCLHLPSRFKEPAQESTFAAWELGDVVSALLRAQVTPDDPAQDGIAVRPPVRDDRSIPADFSALHIRCSSSVSLVCLFVFCHTTIE